MALKEGKKLIVIAIGIILGIALLVAFSNNIYAQTHTISSINYSATTNPLANGTVLLEGRDGGVITTITNTTGANIASQYQIQNTLQAGANVINLQTLDTAITAGTNGTVVNVSYTYNPSGYLSGSGSRAIVELLTLFSAIGIFTFVLAQLYDSKYFKNILRIK